VDEHDLDMIARQGRNSSLRLDELQGPLFIMVGRIDRDPWRAQSQLGWAMRLAGAFGPRPPRQRRGWRNGPPESRPDQPGRSACGARGSKHLGDRVVLRIRLAARRAPRHLDRVHQRAAGANQRILFGKAPAWRRAGAANEGSIEAGEGPRDPPHITHSGRAVWPLRRTRCGTGPPTSIEVPTRSIVSGPVAAADWRRRPAGRAGGAGAPARPGFDRIAGRPALPRDSCSGSRAI